MDANIIKYSPYILTALAIATLVLVSKDYRQVKIVTPLGSIEAIK